MAAPLAPATAADFTALGVAPAEAAMLAAQHEALAGRSGYEAKAAMSIAARDQPPVAKAAPPASTITQAEAAAALDAHGEAQLAQDMAATFAPPRSALDYRIPSRDNPTDEQLAQDMALRTAAHAAALPTLVVNPIAADVTAAARALRSPEALTARVESEHNSLVRMWGADYAENHKAVTALLSRLEAQSPALRDWIANAEPYLSAMNMNTLLQYAKYGGKR